MTPTFEIINASAGSGKTFALAERVLTKILKSQDDDYFKRILALTFTNKAAQEMNERVMSLVNVNTSKMSIGTFHSICAKILRKHASAANLKSNFTIIDTDDQIRLIKNICKAEKLD